MAAIALVMPGCPIATTIWGLAFDPGLRSAAPSRFACRLHHSLARRIPGYVDDRIASGKAAALSVSQITATEWPVYGAFFWLLATENLQAAWERDHSLAPQAPAVSGADAIEASARILLDEGHAHWLRTYWGENHLSEQNCFYRMLLVGSLTAHHRLTGKTDHLPLLRQVVDDLVSDIDSSPKGLIDDYPQQCFPCDVAVAVAMVRRADSALGTDRRTWAEQALRRIMANFPGQLPPYMARQESGIAIAPSRGCTNGFFFSFAREIDPALADSLYQVFAASFWQETGLAAGWREFPHGSNHPATYFDPDSGPVVGGFGTSATGLGLGAARLHADHERAGRLGAELIAAAVPLPDGSLLVPRCISDHVHAPLFAELVILHQLSLGTAPAPERMAPVSACVWSILGVELLLGALMLRVAWWGLKYPPPRRQIRDDRKP